MNDNFLKMTLIIFLISLATSGLFSFLFRKNTMWNKLITVLGHIVLASIVTLSIEFLLFWIACHNARCFG